MKVEMSELPVGTAGFEPATLDPQDGGLGVTAAQGVFFVRVNCSPTCGLFSVSHAVWSPDGPQESC
jgi:hypothetical protein